MEQRLEVTEDRLLNGRVKLKQYKSAYRVAIDPVLLAATIFAEPGARILDLGCGTGAAALCLAARLPSVFIEGIEREAPFADLAAQNVVSNGFTDRITIRIEDLRDLVGQAGAFDWAMANPPFFKKGQATPSPSALKAAANIEDNTILADWLGASLSSVKSGGYVSFIHHWDRAGELIDGLAPHGALVVQPLCGKEGQAPIRGLFQLKKGCPDERIILPTMALHDPDSRYKPAIEQVLRGAKHFPLFHPVDLSRGHS